ncbi:MAG: hypothetical protein CVU56_21160 [Deltaproteobacteria bacterium HGW-Deltaproteobacteria-14]|jgi:ribonuclease D|nr:MAG: hypothetical protein CVU56_21160 [Deltaproteobacteria bacterium HGW-Deltaproteobacteria-14]
MNLPKHTWVVDPQGLDRLARAVADAPWTALDTESNSMFVYQERVCLMQFNAGGELFVVDNLALPLGPDALGPLHAALSDPARVLYVHGGEYDVACLKRDYGLALPRVFDTQQAASLLGFERTGYGSIVRDLLDVDLPKEHTQHNWGRRPVDPDALRYALDDVLHLPVIARLLEGHVRDADLAEEVAIACDAVCEASAHNSDFDPLRVYRIKGLEDLDRRQQGVLYAVYAWRDQAAAQADVPPGRFLASAALPSLARRAPTDVGELKKTAARRIAGRFGDELVRVIRAALDDPPALPERPRRPPPDPAVRKREQKLKQWRQREAAKRGVTLAVVLPARALEHLAHNGAADLTAVPQLGPKRISLYREDLERIAGA